MDKPYILLIGAGGHCRSCIDVIEQEGRFSIAGIVDKAGGAYSLKLKAERGLEELRGKREGGDGKGEAEEEGVLGYPIVGTDDVLSELRKKYQYALVTVGQIKSPGVRIRLFDRLLDLGFEMPTIVSPLAYVSKHARIGQGTIIMHHALVNAGARIGNNCIINTKALIEHDAIIEKNCHIATGAVVNGNAIFSNGSFMGSNAVIREGLVVGKLCLVGSRVCVKTNLKDKTKYIK